MHESFEAPGAILDWCKKNNVEVSYTKFYNGDTLPEGFFDFDMLFVMGGPQCPSTTTDECSYFNAQAEIEFIKKAIDADKAILGVCLGAQLIGEALGAKFDHSPNREIGVFDLHLTADAKKDPVFSKFDDKFGVGHWHGDMPGLTKDAQILAYSEGCPRQIVKYSPKIYGFQCHFEFNRDSVKGMIENSAEELEKYKDLPYIETPEELLSHDYSDMNAKLFTFLDFLSSQIN
jgi:GMP synthase (glutamine-hydrolysing)